MIIYRFIILAVLPAVAATVFGQTPIDREAVVRRHNIVSNDLNLQLPLGNGNFCVTVDGTGLQTFGGNIMSHDAWHTSPLPDGFTIQDVPETGSFQKGRCQPGQGDTALLEGVEKSRAETLRKWMFDNPHIANLGRIRLMRPGGVEIKPEEIKNLERELDLWDGSHRSSFEIDNISVTITMKVSADNVIFLIYKSLLFAEKKIEIVLDFPYPNEQQGQWVGKFDSPERHTTTLEKTSYDGTFALRRKADNLNYFFLALSAGTPKVDANNPHRICYSGTSEGQIASLILLFSTDKKNVTEATKELFDPMHDPLRPVDVFPNFWQTGAAIDLSESTDPRWRELERRIVLSQYLLRVNTAGTLPSAEAGLLTTDPWRGQYHYEMVWWHLAHYALWDRLNCSDEALKCYEKHKPVAKKLAEQLGYKGYKWGKSVGPEGRTAPWRGNQVLLWKQPHPMFFAELEYRNRPTRETLEKWADILEGTAENMADYVTKDENNIYHLDPVMPPGELGITKDTAFDLAYWRFGLDTANTWRQRMGKERNPLWDEVRKNLAPLPTIDADGGKVFVHSAEWLDSYAKRNWEHPDLIGFFGMLPPLEGVDQETAKQTLRKVAQEWQWNRCWGWDFPWMAMAAAKAGEPELAVEMLLHGSSRNRYDDRGVNLGGPCPYLPGNGGLLYAVAMMAAGWDGAPKQNAPGFPQNGKWKIRFEGLKQAP
ncbi:MAG: hypothetical protein LBT46_10110 [Planctomycetaceae bacterium]|jgi:hypothetical protein|nr:hypothetical protein [Planctomycetaceae bacterium]